MVFEGSEGSGKSTQAKLLAAGLREVGKRVVLTREPGGTQLGEQLRRVLLDLQAEPVTAVAEALLYSAARAEHVEHVIRPALNAGESVVCDRFVDSTLAYQGGGRGLDLGQLRAVQRFATGGVAPDLRILLDLPVEIGLARRRSVEGSINRLDSESVAFHQRVRDSYRAAVEANPKDWCVIDATQVPDRVAVAVWSVVQGRLG